MIRRFFKDMPKPIFKKGKYEIWTNKFFYFGDFQYQSHGISNNLFFAYIRARLHALWIDVDSDEESYGVAWKIKELKHENN